MTVLEVIAAGSSGASSFGLLAVLLGPVLWALGFVVLYWVIRLAVRHGVRDANERR